MPQRAQEWREPGLLSVYAMLCLVLKAECCAAEGTVWVGWSTGNGTIFANQQAPYYPNATLYAPQTPDPATYSASVSPLPPPLPPHHTHAARWPAWPDCCQGRHVPGVHA